MKSQNFLHGFAWHESPKSPFETINETIKNVIHAKSGISGKMIVQAVSKSRATVMRALASLKQNGEVVYRGSKKTGGYYLVQALQTALGKGIIQNVKSTARNVLAFSCVVFGYIGLCAASNGVAHSCSIPPSQEINGVTPPEARYNSQHNAHSAKKRC